jgi:replicative DNA helicase
MLSDLRDSGTIEQNSDVVMFIHRPEYYGIQTFEDGESAVDMAEIIVAKNRGGNVGTIRLGFEGKYTRFKNLGLQMPSLDINPNKFLEPNREENQF